MSSTCSSPTTNATNYHEVGGDILGACGTPTTHSDNGGVAFQVFQDNQLYKLLLGFIPKYLKEEEGRAVVMKFCPKIKPNNKEENDDDDDSSCCTTSSTASFPSDDDSTMNEENNGTDAVSDKQQEKKTKTTTDPTNVVDIILGIGEYTFEYKNEEFIAIHHEVGIPCASFNGPPQTRRDLTIIAKKKNKNSDCLHALRQLVADVYLGSISKAKKGTFKIFRWNVNCEYWAHETTTAARTLQSVIMDPETKSIIINDLDDFLGGEAKSFYIKHGIPYRRSYLLYGQPGSGKTSLIQALAGHYGRNVCFIQPTNPKINDDSFKAALNELPAKSIVVLEDIDSLFDKDRSKNAGTGGGSSLTFSGLLNALDGIGSSDGRLVFMTTNYRNKLDSALIRPGRVDLHVYFPYATKYQMIEYFHQYYPHAADGVAEEFANRLCKDLESKELNIATASLQHFFVTHRKLSPIEALDAVGDICEEAKLRLDEEEQEKKKKEEEEEDENESSRAASIDFMDITLSLRDGSIHTTLFEKALNLYLYIPPHSAHPPGVLSGLVSGNINRITNLCSDSTDIKAKVQAFYNRLLHRGYKPTTLLPLFRRALTPKATPVARSLSTDTIFLHLEYHPDDPPSKSLQQSWRQHFSECSYAPPLNQMSNHDNQRINIKRMIVGYSRPPNLGNLLSSRQLSSTGPPVSSYRSRITNREGHGPLPPGSVTTRQVSLDWYWRPSGNTPHHRQTAG